MKKVTAFKSEIKMLEKRKDELKAFLEAAIDDILRKRKKELKELGIDVKRPEVAKFIKKRRTKMEALGQNELDAINNQIEGLKKSHVRS